MARYCPPPPEYRPGLVFQLREVPEGGGLRATVQQRPTLDPSGRREAVVLVHGFNNHEGEAGAAYQGFRLRQYERDGSLLPPALEATLADVMWPGDAAWGLADLADFLVYPVAVGTAREAATRLAAHLRGMPNALVVHFIGHSLGCRVVLETMRDIVQNGGPVVGRVCLMAAAVPLFKVESAGELAAAMRYAGAVLVLYSEDDVVLKYAFRPGQTVAAGDEGVFPAALGSRRPPPSVAGMVEAIDVRGAGHGDYWGHSLTPASRVATDRVGEFFQFSRGARVLATKEPTPTARPESAAPREVGYQRLV